MGQSDSSVAPSSTSSDANGIADASEELSFQPGIEVWRTSDEFSFRQRARRSIAKFATFRRIRETIGLLKFAGVPTTAVIIDPALVAAERGHNYAALLRVKAALSTLNVEHTCLASTTADAVVRELAAPVLPTNALWWRACYTRSDDARSEFLSDVRAIRNSLSVALNDLKRPPDLLILPCCDSVQILALADYYDQSRRIPTPHLLIWLLMKPNIVKPTVDPSAATQIDEYREAFAALRRAIGNEGKISVYCETQALAAVYSDIGSLDVGVAPCPNLAGAHAKRFGRRKAPSSRIVMLGNVHQGKGYHLLPEAVREVLSSHNSATFFIHGTLQSADVNSVVFDILSGMGTGVVTSNAVLTSSEYLSYLLDADVLLLPYDNEIYEGRGSGIFNEAREIGIPVVATRGCAFAQPAFDEGWGVEIVEYSGPGIARAILAALKRLPDLSARAEEASRKYRSCDIGAILSKIVREIDPAERSVRAAAVKCGLEDALRSEV